MSVCTLTYQRTQCTNYFIVIKMVSLLYKSMCIIISIITRVSVCITKYIEKIWKRTKRGHVLNTGFPHVAFFGKRKESAECSFIQSLSRRLFPIPTESPCDQSEWKHIITLRLCIHHHIIFKLLFREKRRKNHPCLLKQTKGYI